MGPKRGKPGPEEHPVLTVPIGQLSPEIGERIEKAEQMLARAVETADQLQRLRGLYSTWDEYNTTLLRRAFTTWGPANEYSKSTVSARVIVPGAPRPTVEERANELRGHIRTRVRRLSSIADRLALFTPITTASPADPEPAVTGTAIFIVHGHDEARKQEVAVVVAQLTGERPMILHERPNKGRTIIEKLEAQKPRVGFAIVIVTGDDEGRSRHGEPQAALSARGRQNVVFEAGFFIGVLGRSRVVILMEDGVERPSDIDGLVYVKLDDHGAWKLELGRELKAADFDVDLNPLIQ